MLALSILDGAGDSGHNGFDCLYNGLLKDYLIVDPIIHDKLKGDLHAIADKYPNVHICVGFRTSISDTSISNRIIHYKDITKIGSEPLLVPYFLYEEREGEERALIIVEDGGYAWLYAKGLYYALTENGALLNEAKNEIVATGYDESTDLVGLYDSLFTASAGAIQRKLDKGCYNSYEELLDRCIKAADEQKRSAEETLPEMKERTAAIGDYVTRWYLLKKVAYVLYMMNKTSLAQVHNGNVHKQRNQAKSYADEIPFYSYSQMWRMQKEEEETTPDA